MPAGAIATTALVAVLLNLGAGAAVHQVIQRWGNKPLPRTEKVMEVEFVEEEEDLLALPEELRPKEKEEVVEQHQVLNEKKPKDTNRVSEFDQDVEKETRAPNQRPQQGTPAVPKGQPVPEDSKKPASEGEGEGDAENADAQGNVGEGAAASADSQLTRDERGKLAAEEGASSQNNPTALMGSTDALRNTFGQPGTLDRPDVDEGAKNILDSKRHKFASFFNRVKRAIGETWKAKDVMHARDPHANKYGKKTRTTFLRLRLEPDGSLLRATIIQSCGLDFLDEEAVRSVRSAAPFTNPPAGLVDPETGYIEFNFGFTLYFDGKVRIFRYRQ